MRNPNQRGDQHVRVTVATPKKLTDKQRRLLIEFAKEGKEDISILQESKSILEKFKDVFK